ncbi:GIY-YIG nuclease family protein [Magnetospira sp. QH-2]|uniref:GIY-YIG nuclease family protein n=1 Tax=Magnetospira sp. (strain QH-2) TaxID=1288970 RepID=UPI0003E8155D|nr:GIY-YIG nuclease family protein [Magnetospira sp. QH-2]CCQ72501.1 GIY-YIG catalytic domain protein [Magnetospira sp. QH-2]
MGAFVYLLRCADGKYYVGTTRRGLEERINEHNHGIGGAFTKARRPVELVKAEEFPQITDAIAMERRLKGWSRAKKEAWARGDFEALIALSRSKEP